MVQQNHHRLIYEFLNDNYYHDLTKYILPNGHKMEDKVEFTRKKIKTEK